MLGQQLVNTIVNLILLVGIPLAVYVAWHRRKSSMTLGEIRARAGLQTAIFLAPHLLLLFVMPEHWPLRVLIFLGAAFAGWARIRSESILGPWLLHRGINFGVTLYVLFNTLP
jgi:hypothetical protein